MSSDQSSVVTTLVGLSLTLATAAAQGLGVPREVWVVTAIASGVTLVAALVLFTIRLNHALRAGVPPGRTGTRRVRSLLDWQSEIAAVAAVLGLLAIVAWVVTTIDLGGSPPATVIVCVDSSSSTANVRASYTSDLRTVVGQAAEGRARLYADACGANAAGSVNWPVRTNFANIRALGLLGREQARLQAERVIAQAIPRLVGPGPESRGLPLGEVLEVMARQCEEAGGHCTLYFFTDAEWSDGLLRVRDGIGPGERHEYLSTFEPELQGLDGCEVNFIGVGFGTSMGSVRLAEARELAAKLIEGAGGELGSWATRLQVEGASLSQ